MTNLKNNTMNYPRVSACVGMTTVFKLIIVFASLSASSSCSSTRIESSSTKLLFKVELRDISNDTITEFRVFENDLLNKTIIHSTANSAAEHSDLFISKFVKLNDEQGRQTKDFLRKLQELDYKNFFPWKEDFYKRGNVIKFEFPAQIKVQNRNIAVPKVFFFYEGHPDSPELFHQINKFLLGIPN